MRRIFVLTNFSERFDAYRFLNNDQSAADSANFMAKVKFPGVDEDITAPNTPWIYYGVRALTYDVVILY